MSAFPPLDRLLPQTGPMRLLSHIVSHTREETVCAVDRSGSELFRDASGSVPSWVALEYMAQCVCAHGMLLDGLSAPKPGLLVGAKRLLLHVDEFAPDESLLVHARITQRIGRLASLECALRAGGELLAEATLSVFVPDSLPGVTA